MWASCRDPLLKGSNGWGKSRSVRSFVSLKNLSEVWSALLMMGIERKKVTRQEHKAHHKKLQCSHLLQYGYVNFLFYAILFNRNFLCVIVEDNLTERIVHNWLMCQFSSQTNGCHAKTEFIHLATLWRTYESCFKLNAKNERLQSTFLQYLYRKNIRIRKIYEHMIS